MNHKTHFKKSGLMIALAMVGLLAALLVPEASGQNSAYSLAPQQPNFYRSDTNAFPCTLSATTGASNYVASSTNSLKLTLRQDKGLSMFAQITVTNTSTATSGVVQFSFSPSWDGLTNHFTTTPPLVWAIPVTVAATSTNTYVFWTNWPSSTLNNVRCIQCVQVTNTIGLATTVNGLTYSYSGQ